MEQTSSALRADRSSATRAFRPIPPHLPGEPRPFPLEPLMDHIRPRDGQWWSNGQLQATDGALPTFCESLGVRRELAYRWARAGIGVHVADAIAVRLGVHPVFIWPDWYAYSPTEEELAASEAEALAVATVVQLRNRGITFPAIANALREKGLLHPRTGRPWTKDSARDAYNRAASPSDDGEAA